MSDPDRAEPGTPKVVETTDGTPLHVESWAPEGPPRFVVCVVHGAAEHVSRYGRLARKWNAEGGLVFGPDHRGQGRSGGPRGHVDSFATYAGDLLAVLRDAQRSAPPEAAPGAIPWFIFAHSMGGLIALTYLVLHAADFPLRGAMISAPLIQPVKPPSVALRTVAGMVGRIAPTVGFPTGIDPSLISRDLTEVALYRDDKRRVTVLTPTWLGAMERAVTDVRDRVSGLELPMLWYVGTGDRICAHEATIALHRRLAGAAERDQTLVTYEGYYHELHNEPAALRAPIERMLVDWVTTRS